MPTVIMQGHDHAYPISDILRLFYGPGIQSSRFIVTSGNESPLIYSILEEDSDGFSRVATNWTSDGRTWKASTIVADSFAKRELKRQLYQGLSELTGLHFPWGSLTGIRPTQVAAESIRLHKNKTDACRDLIETWFVSPEKADLAVDTARSEERLLSVLPEKSAMVYLGVPFCPSRCSYCSFIAQDALHKANLLAPYVEAILEETETIFSRIEGSIPIAAVYVGGGTPTSLPDELFERLLKGVISRLPLTTDFELTVEAGRPDTISREKLSVIRETGASRLCINPQTFHDATLERIGRRHTTAQTAAAFKLARDMGFNSINMDLIAGLPGEVPEDFLDSLEQALQLEPDSITVHSLAMKRSSRLNQRSRELEIHPGLPDPALAAALASARQSLATAGLFPYYLYRQKDVAGGLENTGFAKSGHESLYNVGMMSDRCSVIGLGSGAMSKKIIGTRVERQPNPRDIADYIRRAAEMADRKISLFMDGAR